MIGGSVLGNLKDVLDGDGSGGDAPPELVRTFAGATMGRRYRSLRALGNGGGLRKHSRKSIGRGRSPCP
jgi:hypothetical protein